MLMVKKIFLSFIIVTTVILTFTFYKNLVFSSLTSGAPPYIAEDLEPPEENEFSFLSNWKRTDGPPKVGLQVGHWKNNELPDELERLRGNTGATGGGKKEWEVNMKIAELTAQLLKDKGVVVDILPSTVPEKYLADAFIAIHADGSLDTGKSGFKAATPRRDFSGKGKSLLSFVESEYQKSTEIPLDPNVTRNMRGYYAFAWWRYENAVHPMTTSVILETGFLTSPEDRKIIVGSPEKSADGLATGIIEYLKSEKIL